ncbi:peroxisomal copper amine oxidase [Hypoxylon texense]
MVEKRRPKESTSTQAEAPEYVTARRERGKLAQRAFRQRQIDTIRSLEDENQKLRDAISAICDVAGQDSAALSLAISKARKVAGLPVAEAERQPSAPAAISSDDSGWSSNESNDGIANVTPTTLPSEDDNLELTLPSFDSSESNELWSQLLTADNSAVYDQPTTLKILDTGVDISMLSSMYTGEQMNSTAVPEIWPDADRPLQMVQPPPDIVPYMGLGAYTVAGQLYWTAMAFGFNAIRAIVSSPSPPPAAVDIVAEQFTFTMKYAALPQIMYMMHARLLFRKHGYFQHPANRSADEQQYWSWALDPHMARELGVDLGREFQRAGVSKDDFLTPLDVERRLRDRFRDGYAVFEAALKGQALAEEHVACMRRLLQIMSRQSICFGDGPRWKPESVETLISGWETNTSPIAVS